MGLFCENRIFTATETAIVEITETHCGDQKVESKSRSHVTIPSMYQQTFQVPKMEVLSLIRLFLGGFSLT